MLTGSRTHKMFRACTINPFTATACKISGLRDIIYLSLHCHYQNDSCIKMGSDESHFNVSVGSGGQSHKTVSTNHILTHRDRTDHGPVYRSMIRTVRDGREPRTATSTFTQLLSSAVPFIIVIR